MKSEQIAIFADQFSDGMLGPGEAEEFKKFIMAAIAAYLGGRLMELQGKLTFKEISGHAEE